MRQWRISDTTSAKIDKSRHILIEVGGAAAADVHFHAGSKNTAKDIFAKLESSRSLAHASIEATPVIIPRRFASPSDQAEQEAIEGQQAVALYDFQAQADDELTVAEGDALWVIEKDGDEWWKCRNVEGKEGVVPAPYVEVGSLLPRHFPFLTRGNLQPTGAGRLPLRIEAEEAARRERQAAKAATKATRSPRPTPGGRKSVKRRACCHIPNIMTHIASSRYSPDPSQTRDRTGQFRVRVGAAFLGFENGVLRLHKGNGVIIEVPSEKRRCQSKICTMSRRSQVALQVAEVHTYIRRIGSSFS